MFFHHLHAFFVRRRHREAGEFHAARTGAESASVTVQTNIAYIAPVHVVLFPRGGKRKQYFIPAHFAIRKQRINHKRILVRVAVRRSRTDIDIEIPRNVFISVKRSLIIETQPERDRSFVRRIHRACVCLFEREIRKHVSPAVTAVRRHFLSVHGFRGGGHIIGRSDIQRNVCGSLCTNGRYDRKAAQHKCCYESEYRAENRSIPMFDFLHIFSFLSAHFAEPFCCAINP